MRRVDIFFYGLFMDESLLHSKAINPEGAEHAFVERFALRIGARATLVPSPQGTVHGRIFSLTLSEVERLYSEPSVEAYRPQAVLAHLARGGIIPALCYNLPQAPSPSERNPEYAGKLRALATKIGLPADYVATIQ
jgi:hypothetical protein